MEGRRASCAKPNRRAGILFLDDGPCDCCDAETEIAIIDFGVYSDYHWNVCKKCLQEFVYQMCTEKELRKLKLKQINENT